MPALLRPPLLSYFFFGFLLMASLFGGSLKSHPHLFSDILFWVLITSLLVFFPFLFTEVHLYRKQFTLSFVYAFLLGLGLVCINLFMWFLWVAIGDTLISHIQIWLGYEKETCLCKYRCCGLIIAGWIIPTLLALFSFFPALLFGSLQYFSFTLLSPPLSGRQGYELAKKSIIKKYFVLLPICLLLYMAAIYYQQYYIVDWRTVVECVKEEPFKKD